MARTFGALSLFVDTQDREHFITLLSRRLRECGCRCYAWALMDTHYHLLVRTSERQLWRVMKPLNTDYAHYYNRRHVRRGPLFAERYKSIVTQDQGYLQEVLRYVHLNPIRSGTCRSLRALDSYPWTGHSCLMGVIARDFQETRTVLRRFGRTASEGRRAYARFMQEGLVEQGASTVVDTIRMNNAGTTERTTPDCWVMGDSEFQKAVLRRDHENRLTIARFCKSGLTLETLLRAVAERFGLLEDVVLRVSKRTDAASARKVFCCLACQAGFPTRETGAFLGIQQAAVSSSARKGQNIVKGTGLSLESFCR